MSEALSAQRSSVPQQEFGVVLDKLFEFNITATGRSQENLLLAATVSANVQGACVLVVVSKYFEISHVKSHLQNLLKKEKDVSVGVVCGQTFEGSKETRLWVTSADVALLYISKLRTIAPFTHIFVPCCLDAAPLLPCFVNYISRWMASDAPHSKSVRLVVTTERDQSKRVETAIGGAKVPFLIENAVHPVQFSFSEVCSIIGKEMMEMDKDASGKFPSPPKRLIEYTAQLAAELVRYITAKSHTSQVIIIFTADVREALTALQEAHIENCAVYSGVKSTEDGVESKHRVHVMNHIRHALDSDNEYTMVLDMGTIRRPTTQHKSESFIAATTSEWETKTELDERIFTVSGGEGNCYFAFYMDEVGASFLEEAQSVPDISSVESAFVQCARLGLSTHDVVSMMPFVSPEMTDYVMQKVAEKCMISSPNSLNITFVGEMTARLPVEIDIAYFIICGCSLGLGEAALVIGSVAALPFRSTTPLTYSMNRWSESTRGSREKYGGTIASNSDLVADTLVFMEWLKLRASGAPTAAFLEEVLLQEFKLEKIECLMNFMRDQLTNYAFLDRLASLSQIENTVLSLRKNSSILLLLMSVALARRAAFIRDAGHICEKARYASMVFVRTSKQLVVHSFIPTSTKWESGGIMVPIILKNSTTILGGMFSLIHTPYFFVSLLLFYPQIEYSSPVTTEKGRVVYFGVSCNLQMKRFVVSIDEAAQILDFRENINLAMGCMQALRVLPRPISQTKFALALKEQDRLFDMDRLHKEIQQQLQEFITEIVVQEHQGSFEVFAKHCIMPKELIPVSDLPPADVLMLQRFADGTLWEDRQQTPQSGVVTGSTLHTANMTLNPFEGGITDMDDDDDVEVIQESYFMRHGPLIEDDD
uniref:Uncharacterized protein n=1 Tax=Trypanosoma congolense (strain IL3000) TaxID=1068625 RepID=G0UUM6_TRYCI|nr:conserved hypothetical protein [Trypanosoma congolense IL3000]